MTRDGLIDKNLATGEESRASQRGQEFNLRQNGPQEAQRPFDPPARQPSSIRQQLHTATEQAADLRQEARPAEAPASGPYAQDTGQPDLPMEAARPTARAFEARSHESAAGPPPRQKQAAKQAASQHQNTTDTPHAAGPYEAPASQPATQYSAENPPNTHHSATGKPPTVPPSPETPTEAGQRGRLKFAGGQPQAPPGAKPKQHGTKYQQQFTPDAAGPDKAPVSEAPAPATASRLRFTADEQPPAPDKKLAKLQDRADRTTAKLEKARDKLPSKKRLKKQRVYDEAKEKGKTKFTFEKEIIPQGAAKPPISERVGKAGGHAASRTVANKLHQKVSEIEKENVGVEGAHKLERAAEGVYRTGKRVTRSTYRFVKDRPYRTVAKLEKQAAKANIKLSYRAALNDNPKLKSNIISRMLQKRKIKQQYAKAAREAAKRGAKAAKKTGSVIGSAAKATVAFVKRHPVVFGIIALILLIVFFITSLFTSCTNMGTGSVGAMFASSYLAEDADIDNAELRYTEWETDLLLQVENAETDHPDYDEYRYNVDDVIHDPYELMAFLTATRQAFTFADAQAVLQEVFNEQYSLSFVPEVEIRTRMVEKTRAVYDETTGDYLGDETYEEEEEYEWHILNVNLTARSFTDVAAPRMNGDEREIYDLLMRTKGNRQYAASPFAFNWLPYVTSYYGYRVHPISGEKDYHKAVDIGVPTGTEVLASHDGTVSTAANDAGGYGLYIALDGEDGLQTKYAHLSEILVSAGQQVQAGDVIAKSGNTGNSTGPHLHYEVLKNGQYLNPLYFAITNDDGSGSAPPGTPGGPAYAEYPGAPMGDGTYAALMAEAQLHLGKPYVFGAKGPDKFDCSGFVCWSLTHSGVKSIATNAQGLYNASTPVSPADAQPGDLIFFHSTYSTSNTVTHVGIYIGNGQMLHAGKPVQYASFETSYWQNHFYAFGRII